MSTKVVSSIAMVLSFFALSGVLLFVPALWQKMSAIQNKLDLDMDEFNVKRSLISNLFVSIYIKAF